MIATWSAICSMSAIWCDEKKHRHLLGGATCPTSAWSTSSVSGRIEARGRLVEDQQLGAAAEREQQRQLGAHAARQRLHALLGRQLERAQIPLLEIARASADRTSAVKPTISPTVMES